MYQQRKNLQIFNTTNFIILFIIIIATILIIISCIIRYSVDLLISVICLAVLWVHHLFIIVSTKHNLCVSSNDQNSLFQSSFFLKKIRECHPVTFSFGNLSMIMCQYILCFFFVCLDYFYNFICYLIVWSFSHFMTVDDNRTPTKF